ncbi:MAG: hypothetical protein GKS07_06550 [Nitrosopumilus sp.]|nr:MAG: hypothetical protein GKS07_06550 [Nitrosopumilus sp.]
MKIIQIRPEKFMIYLFEKKKISHVEDFEPLAKFNSGKSTDLVKLFIQNLKQKVKPTSVNVYVAPLFLFSEMNLVVCSTKKSTR